VREPGQSAKEVVSIRSGSTIEKALAALVSSTPRTRNPDGRVAADERGRVGGRVAAEKRYRVSRPSRPGTEGREWSGSKVSGLGAERLGAVPRRSDRTLRLHERLPGVRKIVIVLLGIALAVAGCGSDGSKTGKESLSDRLAAAKKSFDKADYIEFTLSTDKLPSGVSEGLYSARGTGTHAPAFKGKVKAKASVTLDVDVIAVEGLVHAKLPFVGWTTIDVAKYGAPDPAALMDNDTGLSSLLTDAKDLKKDGQERDGSTVLTKIAGTIPGDQVHGLFPTAATDDFDATFKLDDKNELVSAEFAGQFYKGESDVTYDLTVDLNASRVSITAP
jgi:lipoprotein LprG